MTYLALRKAKWQPWSDKSRAPTNIASPIQQRCECEDVTDNSILYYMPTVTGTNILLNALNNTMLSI